MESPPSYPGAPKKSNTGLIIGIIALVVVFCCCGGCGLLGYFGIKVAKDATGMLGCSISMGQYREALLSYAEKNGGKLPPAAHWQDDVKPFITVDPELNQPNQPFKIPSADSDFCDEQAKTSIVLNAAVAGKKIDTIKESDIVLFEMPGTGRNRSSAYSEQSYGTSPVSVMGKRRGWIRSTLHSGPETRSQSGKSVKISGNGSSINIESN